MTDSQREKGQKLIIELFSGGAAEEPVPWPDDFVRYSQEHLFGDVWQGPDLSIPERSLITCAALVALGREDEQRTHFRGARNAGISRAKLEAMITHVAHYAGWPVAASALRSLHEVWSAMDGQNAAPREGS